ncbi:hypothetical protein [Streptomyces lavendulae]|uniref:hypothetical protein n=1 Tax=Streptomyces lavendulae TaxID=1914 RepID=UPI0036C0C9B8
MADEQTEVNSKGPAPAQWTPPRDSPGVESQTHPYVRLAKAVGVPALVVFLNNADIADPEMVELVKMEIQEELEKNGFPDDAALFS